MTALRIHLLAAITQLRRGQLAAGNVSLGCYAQSCEVPPVIRDMIHRGDLLQCADLIEQILLPRHAT